MCYPYGEGGLGTRSLQDTITTFEVKLWWRFRAGDSLWARFLQQKYCRKFHPGIVKPSPYDSYIWKRLCSIRTIAESCIHWTVGNGDLSFWHDRWLEEEPLSCHRPGVKSGIKVAEFWRNGDWDRERLCRVLPTAVVDQVCSVPCFDHGLPLQIWKLSSDGKFSFKSTWEHIRQRRPKSALHKSCWNRWLVPTISIFGVRVLSRWIPTDDILQNMGINVVSSCLCCGASETFNHLFVQGTVAREVWAFFYNTFNKTQPDTCDLKIIFSSWTMDTTIEMHVSRLVPMLVLWFLWCGRNDKKHKGIPFTSARVIQRVLRYFQHLALSKLFPRKAWAGCSLAAERLGVDLPPPRVRTVRVVRWQRPEAGVVKLNTDGACKGNPGLAAAGGIARDSDGNPIFMFSEFLGERTSVYAEIYAIWRGLELCHERNLFRVWVESDSVIALALIQPLKNGHWQIQHLIQRIRRLMEIMEVRLSHIFREGNCVADYLANLGMVHRCFQMHDHNNKSKVRGWLRLDRLGCPYVRVK